MKANHIDARGGRQVEISDDWTEREMVLQNWLEEYAKELRRQGRNARTGHLKMWSKENWKTWDDRQGRLVEPENDRDRQKITKDLVPPENVDFVGFGTEAGTMEHEGEEGGTRAGSWNIVGATKIKEVWIWLEKFDNIALQETWLE